MSKKIKKEIIQQLATKHGIEVKEVEKIVSSQFRLVEKTMAEGNFEAVRLPFFGVFRAKPGRIKHVNNAKRKATENRRRKSSSKSN